LSQYIITHANDRRVSKAIMRVCSVCVCVFVCLFVCPQDNSKTNDPKVFKLGKNYLGI